VLIAYDQLKFEVYVLGYVPIQPGWYMPPHSHELYEFHFITKGKGINKTASEELDLYPGIVYMAPPNEVHEQYSNLENPMELFYTSLSITGLTKDLKRIYITHPLLKEKLQAILTRQNNPGIKNTFHAQSQILQLIWTIISPMIDREKLSLPQTNRRIRANNANTHQVVDRAINYILINKLLNPKVSQISQYCQISQSKLSKLFHRRMHISIQEFIQRERYLWASHELLTTQKSIDDISIALNLNSKQYFCNWFKKYSSKSPIVYRNENNAL